MRRWWHYLLIGLVSYLLFFVSMLPASHIIGWVSSDSPQVPFTYSRIKGTLWSGKMEAMTYRNVPIDKLYWDFAPSLLFFGKIGFDIKIKHLGKTLEGTLAIGMGDEYQFEEVNGEISAELIPRVIDLSLVGVGGQVILDLSQVTVKSQNVTQAEGKIKWLDSALTQPFPLKVGDLQAELTTDQNGQVTAKINDMGGPTGVDGAFSLTQDGKFQVSGHIKPGKTSDPQLGSALSTISKRKPDGSYRIEYSANF
jgi:hypothetical protein